MFVDFDFCHRMASLQKLYSKVKDSNRDLPIVVNAYTNVTSESTAVLGIAP